MFPMFPSVRPPSRPASEPMLPSHPPSAVSAGRLTSRGSIEQVQQSRAGNEIMTYSLAGDRRADRGQLVPRPPAPSPAVGSSWCVPRSLEPGPHGLCSPTFPHSGASNGSLTAPFEAVSEWLERRVDRTAAAGPHPTRRHDAAVDDRAGGGCARLPGRKLLADRALRRGADRRPGRPRRVTGACRPCGGGSGRFGGHGRPGRRLRSPRRVDRTVQPRLEGAPAEHPRSGQARQLRAGADLGRVLGVSAKPAAAPAGPPDQSPVRWDRMLRGQRVARGHPASESCVDSASITTAPPMGSTATTGPMALKSTRSRTRPSNAIDRSSSPCSSCTYRSTTSAPRWRQFRRQRQCARVRRAA